MTRKTNGDSANVPVSSTISVSIRHLHHGFLFFSQTGSTPLFMACQQGQIDVVNILLANGADVNLTGFRVISDGN